MKEIYKKIIIYILIFSCFFTFVETYTLGDISTDAIIVPEYSGHILFLDKPLIIKSPLYYINGRLYLPLYDMVKSMGGTFSYAEDTYQISWSKVNFNLLSEDDENLSYPLHYIEDKPYISLFDFSQFFELAVLFDSPSKTLKFYQRQMPTAPITNEGTQRERAYIRLEDIMANNTNGENLEKLRVIFDYFYSKGQHYYLAWVPLYTDPIKNIQNDLTSEFNFYNADFIYTLDYAVNHYGHIVLHGLTHQEGSTISGIGTEFGGNTPFNKQQIDDRMKHAKEIAEFFGYDSSIFEFPHYSSTLEQVKIAERNFNILYQPSFDIENSTKIDRVFRFGHSVLFVPTPIGYVKSFDELSSTLDAIDSLPSGQLTSLFMHPFIDYDKISAMTTNGHRIFVYDKNSVIPQLISKISDKNMVFSEIEY